MTIKEKAAKISEYKQAAIKSTVRDMKALKVYRPEFDKVIELYADMLAQYSLAWAEFLSSGCKVECKTNAGGVRKTAAATTLEELRRQLRAYAEQLKITPKTYNVEELKEVSKLEKVFAEIGKLQNSP